MQTFSYLDKREVLQHKYSQNLILPSPYFRWVEKAHTLFADSVVTRGQTLLYILLKVPRIRDYVGGVDESVKPIFHWKWGSRWAPNANEIYTKNMKCTCPTPAPTPEGPTPPIFHWLASGVGVGVNANFKFCVGANANFSVRYCQNIPTCWYILR